MNQEEVFFEKGKAFPIGTIRTWGGVKYRKEAKGWVVDSSSERKPSDDSAKGQIKSILQSSATKSQKVRQLMELGLVDKAELTELTGATYSQVHQLVKKHFEELESGEDGGSSDSMSLEDIGLTAQDLGIELPTPSVDEKWEAYEMFSNMVVQGERKAMVAYGTGGVGKTYTLNTVLQENGKKAYTEPEFNEVEVDEDDGGESEEDGSEDRFIPFIEEPYDYIKITGKAAPSAVYQALFEHNGKIVIFDDCDAVLLKDDSINMLKGALDTTGDGTIAYMGKSIKTLKPVPGRSPDKTGRYTIPNRFTFTGQVVFISNLSKEQMPQPIRSRALCVDLTMSKTETIDRMRKIVHKMPFYDKDGKVIDVSAEDRDAAVDFLDKYKGHISIDNFNARTLGSIALVKRTVENRNRETGSNTNWEKMAANLVK